MLHIVTLGQGRARYRNRYVLTEALVDERQVGHALHAGTFESGDATGVGRTGAKNWSNTNVVAHAGRILSLWEGGAPYELTWRFGTVGEHTFDGGLPGAMCAHPKIDPIWDELCWFRYSAEPPYLVYGVVSPRGQISRTVPIDIPRPVLMHDFAVTDQHVVFFDSPRSSTRRRRRPANPWCDGSPSTARASVCCHATASTTACAGSRWRTGSRCTS